MNKRLLNRRQFSVQCAAFGLAFPALRGFAAQATAQVPATGAAAKPAAATVKFPDGTTVPPLGQGCWHLGQDRHPLAVEEQALRTGISSGMTLIDTSGNYGHGRSEQFISRVISGQRERIFLVSKVEGDEVAGDGIARACAASLARLGTDYLDLYLLHWPTPDADLSSIVGAFERLRAAGRIRAWGVSNFEVSDMGALFRVPQGDRCATNQVLYNLDNRGIEQNLLPWCKQHAMPIMAYSPLGGAGVGLLRDPTLAHIGVAHNCSAAAVALAWTIRTGNVIAIPESGSAEHVRENAVALSLALTPDELRALDAAHPPPTR
jgi:diketogulonate reductase-like aldo/keto reductase